MWDEALAEYDEVIGLNLEWCSLDGSLHKAPFGGGETGAKPTDRGKGGVKRSLLVGAQGLPIGIELDGANRHDMKRTDSTLASQPPNVVAARQAWYAADVEQHLCLDAGYDYDEVRRIVAAHGYTAHIRPRGEEKKAKAAGQRARR